MSSKIQTLGDFNSQRAQSVQVCGNKGWRPTRTRVRWNVVLIQCADVAAAAEAGTQLIAGVSRDRQSLWKWFRQMRPVARLWGTHRVRGGARNKSDRNDKLVFPTGGGGGFWCFPENGRISQISSLLQNRQFLIVGFCRWWSQII